MIVGRHSKLSEETASNYDVWHREVAAGETGDSPLRFPWYASVFREICSLKPRRVLEVGCGRGDFAILLSKHFPCAAITGVDFSAAAIDIAKERSARLKSEVAFIQGDAQSLPLPDEHFDLVVTCECLEHVEHPSKMTRELGRVAEAGARVCLTTENYLNGMLLARLHASVTGRPFDSGSGVQPRENILFFWQVKRWLIQADLKIERTESCHYQWLLLPGIAPSRLCTTKFDWPLMRTVVKPFGRHYSFFASKPFPA